MVYILRVDFGGGMLTNVRKVSLGEFLRIKFFEIDIYTPWQTIDRNRFFLNSRILERVSSTCLKFLQLKIWNSFSWINGQLNMFQNEFYSCVLFLARSQKVLIYISKKVLDHLEHENIYIYTRCRSFYQNKILLLN